jgi:hypothetical protein
MSDPSAAPPPPPVHPQQPTKGRGLGWFFAISGAIVLLLSVGCMLAVTEGKLFGPSGLFGPDGGLVIVCASPTLILGGVFLWLGSRRLKR